jgi:hypothetical protein
VPVAVGVCQFGPCGLGLKLFEADRYFCQSSPIVRATGQENSVPHLFSVNPGACPNHYGKELNYNGSALS